MIIKRVRETIDKYQMVKPGDRMLVAVSGGADSVFLLHVLHLLREELGIALIVAHFDHCLRPGEDEVETEFVASLANSFHLPFEAGKADFVPGPGSSLEERAREARYRFLDRVRGKFYAQKIAVGHHLNDQAETVIMRLLRGSGPSGLKGIPPIRGRYIVRPLIEISRQEIASYLEQKKIRYVTDPTNLDTRLLRNRVRRELIPQLMTYQPRILELLGQTAEIMRRDTMWQEQEAEVWAKRAAVIREEGEREISLPVFMKLPEALRCGVIRLILRESKGDLRRMGFRHIEAVISLAAGKRPQGRLNLPGRLEARRVYDKLIFSKMEEKAPEGFRYDIEGPGTFHLEALGCNVILEEVTRDEFTGLGASRWTAHLNADGLSYPLTLRSFVPGDKFVPFGMKGHKKIKDFLMALKIPSHVRRKIPILTHRNRLIWVCGFRIDDRFKVGPGTEKILKVKFSGAPVPWISQHQGT